MEIDLRVEQGTLLAAGPDLRDPNFMHTVVLVCQHSAEGAYGLVLNRPSNTTTSAILPDHPLLGHIDAPLWIGGPVGLDTLQILHTVPDRLPGGATLCEGLWIGGELDALGRYLQEEPEAAARTVRLLIGYSGWGAGQLELELATSSWLPAPGDPRRIFNGDPRALWRDVVRSLGTSARGLEDQPPDPQWN